ncbi:MAG TPA: hypothetical protein VNF73_06380 [Candidatus Saccharimonadales bacterium]|nr:hypothetical protein [Candidatus Saccharimonadales bacterium]
MTTTAWGAAGLGDWVGAIVGCGVGRGVGIATGGGVEREPDVVAGVGRGVPDGPPVEGAAVVLP